MDTFTSVDVHHRPFILRMLAPGAVALSMRAFVDPSGWLARGTGRNVGRRRPSAPSQRV